jgi:hypothetical protein
MTAFVSQMKKARPDDESTGAGSHLNIASESLTLLILMPMHNPPENPRMAGLDAHY